MSCFLFIDGKDMIQQADRNDMRLSVEGDGSYAAYEIIFYIEHVVDDETAETSADYRTEHHQARILLLTGQFRGNNLIDQTFQCLRMRLPVRTSCHADAAENKEDQQCAYSGR